MYYKKLKESVTSVSKIYKILLYVTEYTIFQIVNYVINNNILFMMDIAVLFREEIKLDDKFYI